MDYEQNRRERIANDPEYAEKRRLQKRAAAKIDRERNKQARNAARMSAGMTYITGEPCSRGHIGPRYSANQTCIICTQGQQAKAEIIRRERMKAQPDFSVYRRAQKATSNRGYCKRNRDKKNAAWAKWRADRIQRTPKWADLKKIRAVYSASTRISRTTGIQHHVDHVIPLKGKLVSGLHIAENLRVLPGPENLAKGSKFMT